MLLETLGIDQARKPEGACVGVTRVRPTRGPGVGAPPERGNFNFRLQGMEIILICYQGFPVTTSKGLEIKVGAHGLLEER